MSKPLQLQNLNRKPAPLTLPPTPPRTEVPEAEAQALEQRSNPPLLRAVPELAPDPPPPASEGAPVLPLDAPAAPARAGKASKKGSPRRAAEEGERLTVYLPADLHEHVRRYAFDDKASLSHVVTEAVRLLVKQRSRR